MPMTTCVLGHAWTDGWVLCPTCGFGRRNIPAGAAAAQPVVAARAAAAPAAVAAAAPVLVGATAGSQGGGYAEPAAPPEEIILSPDGYWAWDGENWVPAETYRAEVAPDAATVVYGGPTLDEDPTEPAAQPRDPHRINPKLMLAGVVVIAALVSSDIAFGLAPLGHTSSSAATPVVVHHTVNPSVALTRSALTSAAAAETRYRATSGLYSNSTAQLRSYGFTGVTAPAVLDAVGHHGTGFCLVETANPATDRWTLYNSTHGGIQTTTYPTAATALQACTQV